MAGKQRAAEQAVVKAEETLKRMQEHRRSANNEPTQRGPGRPPQVAASIEQVAPEGEAARHEPQRLTEQRAQVTQRLRALGHADHFVDRERGVRRHGKRIAGDIPQHIDTIRTIAQQEPLSETCLERLETAKRVVPKMQTPIEFVSGDVRQQVRQLDLAPTASYVMHAHLMQFAPGGVAGPSGSASARVAWSLACHIQG